MVFFKLSSYAHGQEGPAGGGGQREDPAPQISCGGLILSPRSPRARPKLERVEFPAGF